MKKVISIILVISAILLIILSASVNAKPRHGAGCIPPTRKEAESYPVAPVKRPVGIPASIDLSNMFPPPGDQGERSSCTGWAVGYAMMTYYKNLEFNFDVTSPANQFSPSYIYNQINYGVDQGSYVADAALLLFTHGACSIKSMPYNLYDYNTKPSYANHMEALKYKVKSWGLIHNAPTIKACLAEGIPVIITFPTYENFYRFSPSGYTYTKYEGSYIGNHAVCLTGYDDSKGAYKFINSWGAAWGLNGYGYISYNLVANNLYPKSYNNNTIFAYEITDRRGAEEEDDYGDMIVNAHKWSLDQSSVTSIDGRIEVSGLGNTTPSVSAYDRAESDMFGFTAPKNGTLRVWSSQSTVPMCSALYSANGTRLKLDDKRSGGGNEFRYEYNIIKGNKYYIQCYPGQYNNAVGSYTLNAAYAIKPTGVTLNKSSATITAGESSELIAAVSPNNATDKSVKWKSSDANIASVDYNGRVRGVKAGSAVITVTTNDGVKTAQCKIKVVSPVTSVAIAQDTVYIKSGASAALGAAAVTSDGSKAALTWKSGAPKVVSVDKNGKIKALKSGRATITISADNGKSAKIEVIVGGSAPTSVSIINKPAGSVISVNETLRLNIRVKPDDAQGALSFTSSDVKILSVDAAGQVTALRKGDASIIVTLGNKKTTLSIAVE